jgi:hypothetical protein
MFQTIRTVRMENQNRNMSRKSAYITEELLNGIFKNHEQEWTRRYITSVKGRVAAAIVVLDPAIPVGSVDVDPPVFWYGVLGEKNMNLWPNDRPYLNFAIAKASAAWRTKMNNAEMLNCPELICQGDFKHEGGVWLHNIAVGTSGLEKATDDTAISTQFAEDIYRKISPLHSAVLQTKNTEFFF